MLPKTNKMRFWRSAKVVGVVGETLIKLETNDNEKLTNENKVCKKLEHEELQGSILDLDD
jgi:DNA-binding XRE family transcriptional regulator